MSRGKVLVMGDDTRGFLATVRSLGRQGIEVHAAPADFRSPALASRYIAAVHEVPPWMDGGAEWLASMRALLTAHGFDLVIPCDERGLLPLQHHRDQLTPLARLAIPDDAAIRVLFDKHATRELAQRIGVPVAAGRLARPDDTGANLLEELGDPVVVKPRRSFTLDRLAGRARVHVLSEAGRLDQVLSEAEPDSLLLERFFEGNGMGVSLLAHEGRLLQAFAHQRVHERSGSSFYRISAPLEPETVAACAGIAENLRFTGIAMFEFRQSQAGSWILLEVNARPWGSLPLPVSLGVDFPYRWYRLLVEGVETAAVDYPVGVYGRNLVPDIMASATDAQAQGLHGFALALFLARRVAGLRRVLMRKEVLDVFVKDDPAPARAELGQFWREGLARVSKRLPGAVARRRESAEAQVRAALRRGRPVRVLFVCQGNICRSPFAAGLIRALAAGNEGVEVGSAGMMPAPGRPTPDLFQVAAAHHGIALEAHRSAWLTRAAAEAASLLVVFDGVNQLALDTRYPGLETPVLKLGDLTGVGDIEDPVDAEPPQIASTYAEIRRGIEALARLLA